MYANFLNLNEYLNKVKGGDTVYGNGELDVDLVVPLYYDYVSCFIFFFIICLLGDKFHMAKEECCYEASLST
jgi:hypothetical protein